MRYCHKCGKRIIEGDAFCRNCGTKVFNDSAVDGIEKEQKTDSHEEKKKESIVPLIVVIIVLVALLGGYNYLNSGDIFTFKSVKATGHIMNNFQTVYTVNCPSCNAEYEFSEKINKTQCKNCGKAYPIKYY